MKNFLRNANPFRKKLSENKKSQDEDFAKNREEIRLKNEEADKHRTVVFGEMRFTDKILCMDKKFVNCILPPNPILPGRKLQKLELEKLLYFDLLC